MKKPVTRAQMNAAASGQPMNIGKASAKAVKMPVEDAADARKDKKMGIKEDSPRDKKMDAPKAPKKKAPKK